MYPTPYDRVRLGAFEEFRREFPRAVLGLSDHSLGIYTALGAVPLGASVLEKHFTSDKSWPGPDVPISIDPGELRELIRGSRAIHAALGGKKEILREEEPTIKFAYASVVTTREVHPGEALTNENIWVKRPGTGGIPAADFKKVLGKCVRVHVPKDTQLSWDQIV